MRNRDVAQLRVFNLNETKAFDDEDVSILKSFLGNFKDNVILRGQIYSWIWQNIKIRLTFSHYLLKKVSTKPLSFPEFHIWDSSFDEGKFGRVSTIQGTLALNNDHFILKKYVHCDFIYVTASTQFSFHPLSPQFVSKTAFLLIRNQLFYIDRGSYWPKIILKHVTELAEHDEKKIINRFGIDTGLSSIQTTTRLHKTDLLLFSNFYDLLAAKNVIVKEQHFEPEKWAGLTDVYREAQLAQRMNYLGNVKNPVTSNDLTKSFIKMPKKSGKNLEYILQQDISGSRKLTSEERILITYGLFECLQKIHKPVGADGVARPGVIHRDLKPENIIVDLSTLSVAIIDFNLSKNIGSEEDERGNLYYGSPEFSRVILKDLDHSVADTDSFSNEELSDVYSVAQVAAEIWGLISNHGRIKNEGEEYIIEFCSSVVNTNTIFTVNRAVDVPHELLLDVRDLFEKMSKRIREQRYDLLTTMQAFAALKGVKNLQLTFDYLVDQNTLNQLTCPQVRMNLEKFRVVNRCLYKSREIQRNLCTAITDSRLDIVQELLTYGVDLGAEDPAPLYLAVRRNDLNIARALLNAGADPDNGSCLMTSVYCGYYEMVNLLLDFSVDVKDCDMRVETEGLLRFAEQFQCKEKMQFLFEIYAVENELRNFSLLHMAVLKGHQGIVKLLLDQDMNPGSRCLDSVSSLDLAYIMQQDKIYDLLFSKLTESEKLSSLNKKVMLTLMKNIWEHDFNKADVPKKAVVLFEIIREAYLDSSSLEDDEIAFCGVRKIIYQKLRSQPGIFKPSVQFYKGLLDLLPEPYYMHMTVKSH